MPNAKDVKQSPLYIESFKLGLLILFQIMTLVTLIDFSTKYTLFLISTSDCMVNQECSNYSFLSIGKTVS